MRSAVVVAAAVLLVARADAGPTLGEQLDQAGRAVTRARDQVLAKLHEQQQARVQRVRLAYKLLRAAGDPLAIAPGDRLAVARSRATARLLLARDRAEVALLASEVDSLTARRCASPPIAPAPPRRPPISACCARWPARSSAASAPWSTTAARPRWPVAASTSR
jgi:hypothetical protein